MIRAENIGKYFGRGIKAVDGITFHVEKGNVAGFLGPNGAGKTTTMKMLTGFIQPTFGTASICGFDVSKESIRARSCIGYLPETNFAYGEMTVSEYLYFAAGLRGFFGKEKRKRVSAAVEHATLGTVLNREIDTLSKGFRCRVGLAQAILHDPQVLILDEPTDGLDPNQKLEVRALIQSISTEKAILISTHILDEVENLCNRVIIINAGKITADLTPEELIRQSPRSGAIEAVFRGTAVHVSLSAISGIKNIEKVWVRDGLERYVIYPEKGAKGLLNKIFIAANNHGWEVEDISIDKGRLETLFRSLTLCSDNGAVHN